VPARQEPETLGTAEITPEMAEAGARVLCGKFAVAENDDPEAAAVQCFAAMWKAMQERPADRREASAQA